MCVFGSPVKATDAPVGSQNGWGMAGGGAAGTDVTSVRAAAFDVAFFDATFFDAVFFVFTRLVGFGFFVVR